MTNKDFLCEYGKYIEVNSKEKTARARFNDFDEENIPFFVRIAMSQLITKWLNDEVIPRVFDINEDVAARIDHIVIKEIKGENQ